MQVADIDISKESPCGHGTVICFSVYCGREVHFGELVDGQPADGILQNQLWVDTLVDEEKSQVAHHLLCTLGKDFLIVWVAVTAGDCGLLSGLIMSYLYLTVLRYLG